MSATVAAALKKIAVALLTDKKALKTIGGIVLGVLTLVAVRAIYKWLRKQKEALEDYES